MISHGKFFQQQGESMNFSRWGAGALFTLTCTALIGLSSQVEAASSCVTCHLDEDMLTDSLAVVESKKSAMQSGAG